MDNVAVLTVRQQDAERLALLPQVAAARRDAAQLLQAQRRDAQQ